MCQVEVVLPPGGSPSGRDVMKLFDINADTGVIRIRPVDGDTLDREEAFRYLVFVRYDEIVFIHIEQF